MHEHLPNYDNKITSLKERGKIHGTLPPPPCRHAACTHTYAYRTGG